MLEQLTFIDGTVGIGELTLRLVLATLAGGLLGLERELKDKPLGVRAFALVGLGAAGFSIAILELGSITHGAPGLSDIDPGRVVQGLIGGIGFLGAGAIFHSEDRVRGTATGAGIWTTGAIGLFCGFGLYHLAAVTVIIGLAILVVLGWLVGRKDGHIEK